MAAAELTRTAFYRYFDDRELLLIALLDDVGVHLDAAGNPWKRGAPDPVAELSGNLRQLTEVFVEHGRLLQAISDAATHDDELRRAYLRLADQLVDTTAARIEAEVAAGTSPVENPGEVARALVWMNERYLLRGFGQHPLADPDAAARALAEIWIATIYGHHPARSGS